MKPSSVNYHDYLCLDQLLDCQKLRSEELGQLAHDEHLFIIVHQAYELWFKQIIVEIDSALEVMKQNPIEEKDMAQVVSRLERIHEIQRLLTQQIDVLETMTPMDFLDFRDLLFPASGFQSYQFRVFENKLGLAPQTRVVYNNNPYHSHFSEKLKSQIKETEKAPSLFTVVEKWLERTPFLKSDTYDFWEEYRQAVTQMFEKEKNFIRENKQLDKEHVKINLQLVEKSEAIFSGLFDEKKFDDLRNEGFWRLSHKAVLAALFIHLYRDQPILQIPFRLLTKLKDIDEALTHWRYRHALMANRMLGTKVGTGGSSGAEYLKESTERHKIFNDFIQLTTFFIPRSQLPPAPKGLSLFS